MPSAALMVVSGVMPIALLAAFAVRIEDALGISDAQIGGAISVYFGVSVAAAIPAGRFADRLGPRRSALVAAAMTGTALLGTAGLASSYPILLAFFVIGGAGQSLAAPTSNVILAAAVDDSRLGISMGLKQSSVPLGSLIAGAALALTPTDVSWRWPFVAALIVPSVAVLASRVITINRTAGARRSSPRGNETATMRTMWPLAVGAALSTFSASAITGFIVLGLVDGGLTEARAGVVLTVAGLTSVLIRISSGFLRDLLELRASRGVVFLLVTGAVGYGLAVTGVDFLLLFGAVLAYGAGWGWPALFHLSLVEMYPASPGAATGIARVGLAGGNTLGPLFFGLVFERVGYRFGWTLAASGMLVAAGVIARATREHPTPAELASG